MENKNQKIWTMVTILTVTLLIIIFGGVTYAFFTANNPEGSTASINSTSGKMTITYTDGKSSLLVSENVQPSDKIIIDKIFTLTGTNTTSGLAMPYKIGIKFKNEFSYNQLYYYIKRVSENENITAKLIGEANQTIPGHETETGYTKGTFIKNSDETYLELANGEFKANTNNQTITFNLKIQFPDNNENQDSEKGKSFTGYIVVNNEEKTAVDYIVNLYNEDKENNGLIMDDTEDYNIRYSGSNNDVKNYVFFNNELWRMIGLFDTFNVETQKNEKLIKLIRNDLLGDYSWDSSEQSINEGKGINEWSQSKLMIELNNDYIDTSKISGTTLWYNGLNNTKTGSYDYSKNIKQEYISYIANVRWNISSVDFRQLQLLNCYKQERTYGVSKKLSDGVERTNTWDGKIALMYPSDYGYASRDENCKENLNSSNCKNNNWLSNNLYKWTLSRTIEINTVLRIASSGELYTSGWDGYGTNGTYNIYPVLYLKSNISISNGDGTSSNPYKLKI